MAKNRKIGPANSVIYEILNSGDMVSPKTRELICGIRDWINKNNHITEKQYKTVRNIQKIKKQKEGGDYL